MGLVILFAALDCQARSVWKKAKNTVNHVVHDVVEIGEDAYSSVYSTVGREAWEDSMDFLDHLSAEEYARITSEIQSAEHVAETQLKHIEHVGDGLIHFYTEAGKFVLDASELESVVATMGDYAHDIEHAAEDAEAFAADEINNLKDQLDSLDPGQWLSLAKDTATDIGSDYVDMAENEIMGFLDDAASLVQDDSFFNAIVEEFMHLLASASNANYSSHGAQATDSSIRLLYSHPVGAPEKIKYYTLEESQYKLSSSSPLFSANTRFAFEFDIIDASKQPGVSLPKVTLRAAITTGRNLVQNGNSHFTTFTNLEFAVKPTWSYGVGDFCKSVGGPEALALMVFLLSLGIDPNSAANIKFELPLVLSVKASDDDYTDFDPTNLPGMTMSNGYSLSFVNSKCVFQFGVKPKITLGSEPKLAPKVSAYFAIALAELSLMGVFDKGGAPSFSMDLAGQIEVGVKFDKFNVRQRFKMDYVEYSTARLDPRLYPREFHQESLVASLVRGIKQRAKSRGDSRVGYITSTDHSHFLAGADASNNLLESYGFSDPRNGFNLAAARDGFFLNIQGQSGGDPLTPDPNYAPAPETPTTDPNGEFISPTDESQDTGIERTITGTDTGDTRAEPLMLDEMGDPWPTDFDFSALGDPIKITEVAVKSAGRGGFWHTRSDSDKNVRAKVFLSGEPTGASDSERFYMNEWILDETGACVVAFVSKSNHNSVYIRDGHGSSKFELRAAGDGRDLYNGGASIFMKIPVDHERFTDVYALRSFLYDEDLGYSYPTQVHDDECRVVGIPQLTEMDNIDDQLFYIYDMDQQFPFSPPYHINFQPTDAEVPDGYIVDDGSAYGAQNGWSYGWSEDVTSHARERNINAAQELDTLIYAGGAYWEFALPEGYYDITIQLGDPDPNSARNGMDQSLIMEGFNVQDFNYHNNYDQHTVSDLYVSDGNLTIVPNAHISADFRICWITINVSDAPPAVPDRANDDDTGGLGGH
ncbi:MAG: hypothetical protein AAF984_05270 [Verrucomicrobiota bacterium]